MKIFYMGLESYQARYTYQLTDWTKRAYDNRKIDYVIVPGDTIDDSEAIVTGQVLDAHGRSYFGMSQMMNLVKMLKAGEITKKDAIFFEDMFQPGMESLPYILQQTPDKYRPTVYLRCLAQAIDPDDFVHVWGMSKWMSLYEQMCNEIPNVVILASNEEMVAHMRIANWKAPIYNISGLSFGKEEVQGRVEQKPFMERKNRVVFGARWDQEKQPQFFMDMIGKFKEKHPETEFAICQGGPLRSNNQFYVDEARHLEKQGLLKIYENLKKNEYYEILADSRVLFNCALQDWTSNTVSEADALGCNVLFPAYRSFPEVFANDHTRMYVPWSQEDAMNKLELLLSKPSPSMGQISDWTNGTIDRMLDIMTGKGEQWRRDGPHYRTPVSEPKY
jgi:glycosyltransferase involved in cell wall biosynthesis